VRLAVPRGLEHDDPMIQTVTVYCASSRQTDPAYREAARRVGALLAREGITVVYGGGAVGSMGALADGALSEGGRVIGVLPRFMADLEWGHAGVSELRLVEDMHARKLAMLQVADAVVALPGGCGTLEELLEAITWKRLGLFAGPIALLNRGGFYDPLLAMLDRCVRERFMDERHAAMWLAVREPEEVLPALRAAPPWDGDARRFAVP
jgi:uncharacterized protein (TIGR00730 family)